jgi:N-acetylglucosamine transport system substrate-binding protein
MKGIAPPDFAMTAAPVPVLDSSSAMPVAALRTQPAEAFVVPSKAKNVNGGMEYLRTMLSKEGGMKFAELTASVPAVKDATAQAKKTPALESLTAALAAAGPNVFSWQFRTWYSTYSTLLITETTNLLAGRTDAKGYLAKLQAETDRIAADSSITKYHR